MGVLCTVQILTFQVKFNGTMLVVDINFTKF